MTDNSMTTGQIAEQIVRVLRDLQPDGDLVPWSAVTDRLGPSSYWRRLEALDQLANDGRVWEAKLHGSPYLGLCLDGECADAPVAVFA